MIIIATLTVLILEKSYQTLHGKCEVFLVIGILAIYCSTIASFSDTRAPMFLLIFGSFSSILWLNVLCFNIVWTFRNVEVAIDEKKHLKLYCIYAFPIVPFVIMYINEDHIVRLMEVLTFCYATFYNITTIVNLFMFASTGVKIFRMSESVKFQDNVWFETHKKRWAENFLIGEKFLDFSFIKQILGLRAIALNLSDCLFDTSGKNWIWLIRFLSFRDSWILRSIFCLHGFYDFGQKKRSEQTWK